MDQRPLTVRKPPSNKLSPEECQAIVDTCNRKLSPDTDRPDTSGLGYLSGLRVELLSDFKQNGFTAPSWSKSGSQKAC